MTRWALILVGGAALSACSEGHRRGDDAGVDSGGMRVDSGTMCGAIRCEPGCTTVIGPDGCAVCRCEPLPTSCAVDADCAVATDHGVCCVGCQWAYSRTAVEASGCLARFGDPPPPESCRPEGCTGSCPLIDCANAVWARCQDGMCTGDFVCPAGTVDQHGECWPTCNTHADCVMANDATACCPGCGIVVPRPLAESRDCVATAAEDPPAECMRRDCPEIVCPDVLCESGHPVCMFDGTCELVGDPAACPEGYADSGGRCVPIGG